MASGATPDQTEHVVARLQEAGADARVSRGREATVIGAIGEREALAGLPLEGFPGVERVLPILKPYKLVAREVAPDPTVIEVDGRKIGDTWFGLIAGPCTVEYREQTLETARAVAAAGATMLRGGAFKPRTSPYTFQGLGLDALEVLGRRARRPACRSSPSSWIRATSRTSSKSPTSSRSARATCRTSSCSRRSVGPTSRSC